MTRIRDMRDDDSDTAAVRELFWEYLQWANGKLSEEFNVNFDIGSMLEHDMQTLEKFSPPAGKIVLATDEVTALGLGCLKQLKPGIGEIKRMYLRPEGRGTGLGRELLNGLLAGAEAAGYAQVWLDSAGFMKSAHSLYRSAGFHDIEPYPESEIPQDFQKHWVFMAKDL